MNVIFENLAPHGLHDDHSKLYLYFVNFFCLCTPCFSISTSFIVFPFSFNLLFAVTSMEPCRCTLWFQVRDHTEESRRLVIECKNSYSNLAVTFLSRVIFLPILWKSPLLLLLTSLLNNTLSTAKLITIEVHLRKSHITRWAFELNSIFILTATTTYL